MEKNLYWRLEMKSGKQQKCTAELQVPGVFVPLHH